MSPPILRALAPTPFVTLQDMGRRGWKRFGVSGAGAMDPFALAAANALVGNPAGLAALEFAYGAGTWTVDGVSCRLAVAGGAFLVEVDGLRVPSWTTLTLRRGQTLSVGGAADAVWGYLAVAGGFTIPPRLGSLSTHRRSGVGGFEGRTLREDDRLPLAASQASDEPERVLRREPATEPAEVNAVLGPQDDFFTGEAVRALFTEAFTVTMRCDRLGYCLAGPSLAHAKGADIVSDGVVPGCIQVPANQQPIVLMRDCQPPGGYAKIATVITPDLARVAQTRPGQPIRFRQVAVAEAQLMRRRFLEQLAVLPDQIMPFTDA